MYSVFETIKNSVVTIKNGNNILALKENFLERERVKQWLYLLSEIGKILLNVCVADDIFYVTDLFSIKEKFFLLVLG